VGGQGAGQMGVLQGVWWGQEVGVSLMVPQGWWGWTAGYPRLPLPPHCLKNLKARKGLSAGEQLHSSQTLKADQGPLGPRGRQHGAGVAWWGQG